MSAHHFICQVAAVAVEEMGFRGTRVAVSYVHSVGGGNQTKSSGRAAANEVISLASWIDAQFSQNI